MRDRQGEAFVEAERALIGRQGVVACNIGGKKLRTRARKESGVVV